MFNDIKVVLPLGQNLGLRPKLKPFNILELYSYNTHFGFSDLALLQKCQWIFSYVWLLHITPYNMCSKGFS